MKKDSLGLMGILLMIGLFIPIVIQIYFTQFFPSISSLVTIKWFFLPGVLIISYSIIYIRNINSKNISALIIGNLLIYGIILIWISFVPSLSALPFQKPMMIFQDSLYMMGFYLLPFVIFLNTLLPKKYL